MDTLTDIARALGHDFSDLDAPRAAVLAVRLLVAGAVGALLGWDRERHGKSAGVRTHILVALGTAAFVAAPQLAGLGPDAVSRVIQGLTAGIGFLGAGCIVKSDGEGHVTGLTTAAGIWLTASVGVTAGMGRELAALLVGGFGWFALAVLGRWEERLKAARHPVGGK